MQIGHTTFLKSEARLLVLIAVILTENSSQRAKHCDEGCYSFMHKQSGLFISYKSNDAALVRTIAETLMSHGVRVWFAEYEVLLSNYEEFQLAIDRGIDRCEYAILFATQEWAESRWCQVEIGRIMQRIRMDRILCVNFRTHATVETEENSENMTTRSPSHDRPTTLQIWNHEHILKGRMVRRSDLLAYKEWWMVQKNDDDNGPDMFDVRVPQSEWVNQEKTNWVNPAIIDCRSSDDGLELVPKVLDLLANHTNLYRRAPIFHPPILSVLSSWLSSMLGRSRAVTVNRVFSLFGFVYNLDCGGWEVTSPGGTASESGNFNGPTFRRQLGGALCECQLVIGEGYPSLEATTATLSSMDDRERYRHVRKFAQAFQRACRTQGIDMETCGLHIVELEPAEDSAQVIQAAFTCWFGGSVSPHWQRRYSIAVTHPVTKTVFEFAFTFAFFGSFRTFLQYAFLMERLVTSFRCRVL